MRKATLFLLGLVGISLFTACNNTPTEGTNIYGTTDEGIDSLYVLNVKGRGLDTLGLINPKDGKFEYKLELDSADFIVLRAANKLNIALFVHPDDDLEVNFTKVEDAEENEPPYTYTVSGNAASERIKKLGDIINEATTHVDTLNAMASASGTEEQFQAKKARLDSAFEQIITKTKDQLKAMIDEDPGNMGNIFVLPQSMGQISLFNLSEDAEYFNKVIEALKEKYGDNRHYKTFVRQVEEARRRFAIQEQIQKAEASLVPGAMAPEIAYPDTAGQVRSLSNLRGKVVLIDFWAAWCKPCRMQNPELVKLYDDFNKKGFEVFSVSLDGNPGQGNAELAWEQAIINDDLHWPNHVSELKYWDSSVVPTYAINGIPFTVLVDREGKIIAKGLNLIEVRERLEQVL